MIIREENCGVDLPIGGHSQSGATVALHTKHEDQQIPEDIHSNTCAGEIKGNSEKKRESKKTVRYT